MVHPSPSPFPPSVFTVPSISLPTLTPCLEDITEFRLTAFEQQFHPSILPAIVTELLENRIAWGYVLPDFYLLPFMQFQYFGLWDYHSLCNSYLHILCQHRASSDASVLVSVFFFNSSPSFLFSCLWIILYPHYVITLSSPYSCLLSSILTSINSTYCMTHAILEIDRERGR